MLSPELFEDPTEKTTKLINIRSGAPYDVLIARPSIWGNPFSHLSHGTAKWRVKTREEAVSCYEEYIKSRQDLLNRLHELDGKILGCWCFPLLCHGNVLIKLIPKYR